MKATTSSVGTRLLGLAAFLALGNLVVLGLFVTKPDVVQEELVRMIYIHPALAWTAYLAFGVTAVASAMYLWKRTRNRRYDRIAVASAEVGVVLTLLTLLTGSIWGRPTWGVWWTWDARLTTTALLFVLFLGYLALRRVDNDPDVRARRSAIAALIAVVDIPIVHFSVDWWRTLHQGRTLLRPDPQIEGLQLVTMVLGFVAFSVFYAWLVIHRYRFEELREQKEARTLDLVIDARRREALVGRAEVTFG